VLVDAGVVVRMRFSGHGHMYTSLIDFMLLKHIIGFMKLRGLKQLSLVRIHFLFEEVEKVERSCAGCPRIPTKMK
jgi:hypothetical protein